MPTYISLGALTGRVESKFTQHCNECNDVIAQKLESYTAPQIKYRGHTHKYTSTHTDKIVYILGSYQYCMVVPIPHPWQ